MKLVNTLIDNLIKKAIDKLNNVKHLNLSLKTIIENDFSPGTFTVHVRDTTTGMTFSVALTEDLLNTKRLDEESQSLTIDDIIMLRIAKTIYEQYKLSTQAETATVTLNSPSISSVSLGSTTYDINVMGRSLTNTFDEVDDLKDELQKLKDEKEDLTKQLDSLKAVVDLLLDRCQDKGIL